jgi:hypothetical protein
LRTTQQGSWLQWYQERPIAKSPLVALYSVAGARNDDHHAHEIGNIDRVIAILVR